MPGRPQLPALDSCIRPVRFRGCRGTGLPIPPLRGDGMPGDGPSIQGEIMTTQRALLCICLSLLLRVAPVHGLMLGGTDVPKEKVIVYLLIGHSNMAGIDAGKSDDVTHPHCWNYPMKTKTWV